MVAGCAPKIAKLLLILFNIAVWAVGCVLLSIGSWITYYATLFQDLFISDDLTVVSSLVIAAGVLLFIFSFMGCCGAWKEGTFLLKLYFVLLVVFLCIQATAGIIAFTFVSEIYDSMLEGMTSTINMTYGYYDSATYAVDTIQKEFNCCGALGPSDYRGCQGLQNNQSVPGSCCKTEGNGCQFGENASPGKPDPTKVDLINYNGCVEESLDYVEHYFYVLGGICIGVLVIEVTALVMICIFIRGIKKGKEVA